MPPWFQRQSGRWRECPFRVPSELGGRWLRWKLLQWYGESRLCAPEHCRICPFSELLVRSRVGVYDFAIDPAKSAYSRAASSARSLLRRADQPPCLAKIDQASSESITERPPQSHHPQYSRHDALHISPSIHAKSPPCHQNLARRHTPAEIVARAQRLFRRTCDILPM